MSGSWKHVPNTGERARARTALITDPSGLFVAMCCPHGVMESPTTEVVYDPVLESTHGEKNPSLP